MTDDPEKAIIVQAWPDSRRTVQWWQLDAKIAGITGPYCVATVASGERIGEDVLHIRRECPIDWAEEAWREYTGLRPAEATHDVEWRFGHPAFTEKEDRYA